MMALIQCELLQITSEMQLCASCKSSVVAAMDMDLVPLRCPDSAVSSSASTDLAWGTILCGHHRPAVGRISCSICIARRFGSGISPLGTNSSGGNLWVHETFLKSQDGCCYLPWIAHLSQCQLEKREKVVKTHCWGMTWRVSLQRIFHSTDTSLEYG